MPGWGRDAVWGKMIEIAQVREGGFREFAGRPKELLSLAAAVVVGGRVS